MEFEIINYDKFTLESGKIILSQAEKNLTEEIKASDYLINRALVFLQFFVPLTIALSAYTFSNLDFSNPLFYMSVYGIIFSFIIIFKSISLYKSYGISPLGNSPKNMNIDECIEFDVDNQEKSFIYNAIKSTQYSLEVNKENNKNRAEKVSTIFSIIKYSLLFFTVASFLLFVILPLLQCQG